VKTLTGRNIERALLTFSSPHSSELFVKNRIDKSSFENQNVCNKNKNYQIKEKNCIGPNNLLEHHNKNRLKAEPLRSLSGPLRPPLASQKLESRYSGSRLM
jgi:hypothetical protein